MIWRTLMRTWLASLAFQGRGTARLAGRFAGVRTLSALAALLTVGVGTAMAEPEVGGEAGLKLPDLSQVSFLNGRVDGHNLLLIGILFCIFGLGFGLAIYMRLKNLPVHRSMREISELIYETCKTYLVTQGKFILVLWAFIAVIIAAYFGWLAPVPDKPVALTLPIILAFSLIGIAGSYGVAWFGIRVNTFANSRTAFASLPGKPYPVYQIPLEAGMSIGMMLISVELLIMLVILLFIPGDYAGPCFIGFAIGESLGAAALRVAGGIFTKIADIGSDLMKIVFKIKEDDARNPGVIADCTGDNAGDSVGPSADGFETYGVTGVALISFILLAVHTPLVQVQLLVWIFAMRVMMVVASGFSYFLNAAITKARYQTADHMNYEAPLTTLVWLTSLVSVALTFLASWLLIPTIGGDPTLWWKLSLVITCGTLAGAIIPELVKVFTSTSSRHVREIVTSSREGGASLNILSGFVAGNFSAFWLGMTMMALMAIAFGISTTGLGTLMLAPAVFSFGLVAFGFLGMGPDDRGRFLRPGDGQRAVGLRAVVDRAGAQRPCRDQEGLRVRSELRAGQGEPRGERRGGEHVQGDRQAGADRYRGRGRHDDDLFHYRSADPRVAAGAAVEPVDPASAVSVGADHRRRRDLLVHRCLDAGGDDRRLSRGGVHQGEHPARGHDEGLRGGQQKGGGDLHAICAEGDVQHLPDGLLRDTRVRVLRAVLLHRLSDLDRAVRPLPGHLHGQCGGGMGQRQEDRRDRAEAERHAAARCHGGRRYRGRSVQGHVVGRDESDHQVHD